MNHGLPVPVFSQADVDRFWSKVFKTEHDYECWEWQGYKGKTGYGYIWVQKRNMKASRVAYFIGTGVNPNENFVLHFCDNPACVNITHLRLGNHDDNMLDKKTKGRIPVGLNTGAKKHPESYYKFRGEGNVNAVLTNEQALEIRNSDDSIRTVCEKYGISQASAWRIKNNKSYKYI